MKESREQTTGVKLIPILVSTVVAGALGMIISIGTTALGWPDLYGTAVSLLIAVPFGMLSAYGWDKGFQNINKHDVVNSLFGGVGAVIGIILIHLIK
jgi:hypothetical protein